MLVDDRGDFAGFGKLVADQQNILAQVDRYDEV